VRGTRRSRRWPSVMTAALLLALTATPASAQPGAPDADAREQAFVDSLRRADPAEAERYVALSAARRDAIVELERARARFAAMPPELRGGSLPQLRQAERRYAERSLAILDFLEARDRRTLARYREDIGRLERVLEEHQRLRGELEKVLRGE